MGSISPRVVRLQDGRSCVVRTAHPRDAGPSIALRLALARERDAYLLREADEVDQDAEKRAATLRLQADDPAQLTLVAEPCDEDEGPAASQPHPLLVGELRLASLTHRRTRHVANLGISLAREFRGVGLGRAMMEEAIAWARQHPVLRKVTLEVYRANIPARKLYRSLGFRVEGRRRQQIRTPDGVFHDDLLMALTVK